MYTASGARACAQISVESVVMGANPHQLIEMLFNGVNNTPVRVRLLMQRGDIVVKGEAPGKVTSTIGSSLRAGLDREKGGEFATNLSSSYSYTVRRLLHANLNNDCQAIEEAERLLGNITDAWKQTSPNASSQESR